jgi:hypothetical protein
MIEADAAWHRSHVAALQRLVGELLGATSPRAVDRGSRDQRGAVGGQAARQLRKVVVLDRAPTASSPARSLRPVRV